MMSVTFKGFAYFFDETTHTRSDLPCSCGVIGGLQIFADEVINAQMKIIWLTFVSHASQALIHEIGCTVLLIHRESQQVKSAVLFL